MEQTNLKLPCDCDAGYEWKEVVYKSTEYDPVQDVCKKCKGTGERTVEITADRIVANSYYIHNGFGIDGLGDLHIPKDSPLRVQKFIASADAIKLIEHNVKNIIDKVEEMIDGFYGMTQDIGILDDLKQQLRRLSE